MFPEFCLESVFEYGFGNFSFPIKRDMSLLLLRNNFFNKLKVEIATPSLYYV